MKISKTSFLMLRWCFINWRTTSRAFCCADSLCYVSPVLSLGKNRKLMVYSKAQLCSYSWTLLHLGNFFGDYLTAWFE